MNFKQKANKLIRMLRQEFVYKYANRIATTNNKIEKIGIVANVPKESKKFSNWHDGFVAAVALLKNNFKSVDVIFYNTVPKNELIDLFNQYDFLIIKSGWRSDIDLFLRKNRKHLTSKAGLMISASNRSPSKVEQEFYHVVWYETMWYKKIGVRHSNALHAFGVDTSIMKPMGLEKEFDWICIGAPKNYKRIDLLIHKNGTKLYIGDLTNKDKESLELLDLLKRHNVTILNFCTYSELAVYYNKSKNCYVPCKTHGGGERSVLEAKACGINVVVEADNPKLVNLAREDVWGHKYYYNQLLKGIQST